MEKLQHAAPTPQHAAPTPQHAAPTPQHAEPTPPPATEHTAVYTAPIPPFATGPHANPAPPPRRMLYDIHERPPLGQSIILALQHVCAMFCATILVAILVNLYVGETVLTIPVTLFSSGLATLIYIACTRAGSPVYLGSSFAFITPIVAAYSTGGIAGVMTGTMVVGLIYAITAVIIRIVGKGWINRLLPPIVVGPMIMIIGLSLAPTALSWMGLSSDVINWREVLVALVTFLVTAIIAISGRGFIKVIPILLGLVIGYLAAMVMGLVDLTPVREAAFFQTPDFVIPFIHYTPTFSAALTMAPISLATMSEHIGDHTAVSEIIDKDLLHDPGLDRTLLGDGLATFAAGFLGGPPNTTYGENTSVVGMTKVASVWVIWIAAIFAICLGFLGKFAALVSTIPNPVLGGVSLLLYGFIAVNGLKVLVKNQIDFGNIRNVVVVLVMLVIGLSNVSIPLPIGSTTVTFSGMSLAAIIGILLNLFLPHDRSIEQAETEPVSVVGSPDVRPETEQG